MNKFIGVLAYMKPYKKNAVLGIYNSFDDNLNKLEQKEIAADEANRAAIMAKYNQYRAEFKDKKFKAPVFLKMVNEVFKHLKPSDLINKGEVVVNTYIVEDMVPATLMARTPENLAGLESMINRTFMQPKADTADSFANMQGKRMLANQGREQAENIYMKNAMHISDQERARDATINQNILSAAQMDTQNAMRREGANRDYIERKTAAEIARIEDTYKRQGRRLNAFARVGLDFANAGQKKKTNEEYLNLINKFGIYTNNYAPKIAALDPKSATYDADKEYVYASFYNDEGYDARNFTKDFTERKLGAVTPGA